jgi:hypothetical protein
MMKVGDVIIIGGIDNPNRIARRATELDVMIANLKWTPPSAFVDIEENEGD